MTTPSRLFWIAVSLLALRLVVGWHFYTEGVTKIKAGDFTAEHFLRAAKGPLAEIALRCIPDDDGRIRLGLVQTKSDANRNSSSSDGDVTWALDPLVTEELWKGFAYRAAGHYGFGDERTIESLEKQVQTIRQRIEQSGVRSGPNANGEDLEALLTETRRQLSAVKNQKADALAVVDKYINEYRTFLADNESEILAYFRGEDRGKGFVRDGESRTAVIEGVSSLRGQSEEIQTTRRRDAKDWLAEVDGMWKGVEADINALAVGDQLAGGELRIDAVATNPWSPLPWINRIIPWFDVIVGACLILGLFTRLASMAGAIFMLSIVATQPPWVAGSISTVTHWIEIIALLVLFTTSAGRYAGLDVVVHRFFNRRQHEPMMAEVRA